MQKDELFVVASVPHPVGIVARAGFPLDHPYLEECVLPLVGPSAVALLRRAHLLVQEQNPTVLPFSELAASLGLKRELLGHTVKRLKQYDFARREERSRLTVFNRCPPLTERRLEKVPPSARAAHERLLDEHLQALARSHRSNDHLAATVRFTGRLDHLQRPTPSVPGLGR